MLRPDTPRWRLLLPIVILLALAFIVDLARDYYRKQRVEEDLIAWPRAQLELMSLEDKVGQLMHIGIAGPLPDDGARREIEEHRIGGIILFRRNIEDAARLQELTRKLQEWSVDGGGLPLIISIDQEGGRIRRLEEPAVNVFPSAMALGQAASAELTRDVGFVTGYELARYGVNMVLAPVLDTNNNPNNPVINTRSYHHDPGVVAEMGTAYLEGARLALSGPVIKHFPGHGDTDVDSHEALPVIPRSREELAAVELVPFQAAIDSGAPAVMVAHLLVPALDEEWPTSLSSATMKGLLREEMGFQGLVMTDAIEMKAVAGRNRPADIAIQAFQAGVDVILIAEYSPRENARMHAALVKAFRDGRLSEEELDERVVRQLRYKLDAGLLQRSELLEDWPHLARHMLELHKKREETIGEVRKRYGNERSLSLEAGRTTIRALGKEFQPPEIAIENVRLLCLDPAFIEIGKDFLPEGHVTTLAGDALQASPKMLLVAFSESEIGAWNRMARTHANDFHLVGLYTGNPYRPVETINADEGALLLSFGPNEASRRGLVERALDPTGTIARAVLATDETQDRTENRIGRTRHIDR